MKTQLISLLLLSTISIAAVAADHRHPDNEPAKTVSVAPAATSMPPLAARFELYTAGRGADWFMIREPQRIVTFNAGSRQGEVWARDEQGRIEYTRVFAEDRKTLNYNDGQLKTLHMEPGWAQLASIISPEEVTKLRKTGERKVMGQRALILEGNIDGVRTRLWWLPELQLPARLERGKGKTATRLVLREIHAKTPAAWNWGDESVLDTYARLDASDLGDMEYDPFVQKVMRQDGHQHGHGHL
jgi:hypothetical protein